MNRIILNETSYFGAGCRSVIAVEAARRGFKKAFFVTDKDLVKFGDVYKRQNQFTANAIGIPVVAGPSEATAIGNVMIQAMTVGEATDVAGMRQLIRCV